MRNHLAARAFHTATFLPGRPSPAFQGHKMKNTKVKTAALASGLPLRLAVAITAITLAMLAIPHVGRAQGIVRGAQEGSHEGNRIAGPIGGAVGGAVGAGVGGAVGAVEGIFGVPHRHYHCHGYRDGYGHFHCYR